jgi:hypothetical protein
MGTSIKISFQSRESDRIGESGDLLIMVGNEFFFFEPFGRAAQSPLRKSSNALYERTFHVS